MPRFPTVYALYLIAALTALPYDQVQANPILSKRSPEGPVSILSAFKPGGCGFHLTHYQKPDPSKDPYKVEVIIKDGAGEEIGRLDPTDAPGGKPVPVISRLPNDLIITTGNVDADGIQFQYGEDKWSTDTEGRCSVGAYDSGDREMDCGFGC